MIDTPERRRRYRRNLMYIAIAWVVALIVYSFLPKKPEKMAWILVNNLVFAFVYLISDNT